MLIGYQVFPFAHKTTNSNIPCKKKHVGMFFLLIQNLTNKKKKHFEAHQVT